VHSRHSTFLHQSRDRKSSSSWPDHSCGFGAIKRNLCPLSVRRL